MPSVSTMLETYNVVRTGHIKIRQQTSPFAFIIEMHSENQNPKFEYNTRVWAEECWLSGWMAIVLRLHCVSGFKPSLSPLTRWHRHPRNTSSAHRSSVWGLQLLKVTLIQMCDIILLSLCFCLHWKPGIFVKLLTCFSGGKLAWNRWSSINN